MKKIRISTKFFIFSVLCLASFLLAIVLLFVREGIIRKQLSQQMAERWSEEGDVAQISAFFTRNAYVTKDQIIGFEHSLDSALQEASVKLESENPGARLWADAYSAQGTLRVSTDRAMLTLKAIGVGGDFFQFHPLDLEYGNYFSDNDVNKDYVVIDEEIAWQLFGGIDVPGKIIDVNGKPHMIAGVIKRPQGKMEQKAGLSESIIYVSYETLQESGSADPINHFEIVMPNPIKGFAMDKVKSNLTVDEKESEFIENSTRYSFDNSLKLFGQFAYRSMNGKAIIYPYWENLARGHEDILAILTALVVLFFAVPSLIIAIWLIYRWRHKKWTWKSVWDKLMQIPENMRRRKQSAKNKAEEKKTEKSKTEKIKTEKKKARKKAGKASEPRKPIHITFDEEEENEEE